MTFRVNLERKQNNPVAQATVRDFSLPLGIISGDFSFGFNPAETLLSAAAACLTSAFILVAKNSQVDVGNINVEMEGVRQSDPPRLISLNYRVFVETEASDEKIDTLLKLATRNSTVVSTLSQVLELNGEWKRYKNGN